MLNSDKEYAKCWVCGRLVPVNSHNQLVNHAGSAAGIITPTNELVLTVPCSGSGITVDIAMPLDQWDHQSANTG